jgi:polyisoprenyl-teichoic acid--peptidoglycan teichoic acid transferase
MSEFQTGGDNTPQETDTTQNTQQNPTPDMNTKETQIVDVVPTYSSSLPHQGEPSMTEESQTQPPQKRKSRLTFGKLVSVVVFFIAVILIGVFIFGYSMISNTGSLIGDNTDDGNIFSQLGQIGNILNITKRDPIKGEKEGRTNILLLGKDESGSDLTDTIMIASYFHREKKVVTLNIPRDLWVYNETKINALYTFGEQEEVGNGEQKLIKFINDEYNLPVHYYATINFNGVKDIVDALGGVEVDVQNAFTDYEYPNDGYAFVKGSSFMTPAPSFKVGVEKMDGKRALIYARSRHALGVEGGDFSRSKRQSIIVQSVLQKLKSQNFFDNVTKINTYLGIINKNLKTNMRLDEMTSLAQILKDVDLKENYLTAKWEVDNVLYCYGGSSTGQSIIQYCDGASAGSKTPSKSRNQAAEYVQNLLSRVESTGLYSSSVSLFGNGSFDTDTMYNTFAGWGFTNVSENNAYSAISPATVTSKEKVEIFIKDEKIRTQFQALQNTSKLTYTVGSEIPTTYKIPAAQANSDIIVWVSSK